MQSLGADFYCFSAHKLYGPTGVGVLYGKENVLNELTEIFSNLIGGSADLTGSNNTLAKNLNKDFC